MTENRPNWALATLALIQREAIRFYRQRGRVIGSLGAPLMFWAVLGLGLDAAFTFPTAAATGGAAPANYVTYFFPGVLLLTVLFTSVFSSISIIEDRHEGFLPTVLIAPLDPVVLVLGKVLGGGLLGFIQGLLVLAFAPLAGISLSLAGAATLLAALLLSSLLLAAIGFWFAWKLDSVQGFHSVMNLVLFPLWFLSGAFFPIAAAPHWLQPILQLNPLAHGLFLVKQAVATTAVGVATASTSFVYLIVVTLAAIALSRGLVAARH